MEMAEVPDEADESGESVQTDGVSEHVAVPRTMTEEVNA